MKLTMLLLLICFLVKVQCQDYPYISFSGETLPNHSYVDLGSIQSGGEDIVDCHTDLDTCCSIAEGGHRADWYLPNGDRLNFHNADPIFERRTNKSVALRRSGNSGIPYGIYRCDAPTSNTHDENDISVRALVYVGLYEYYEGTISIPHGCTAVAIEPSQPLKFTLTCISTGGPATTVTWTRDSTTVTEGTETVLSDPVTAQYNHTLNVSVSLGEQYTCTVVNDKPSEALVTIPIEAPQSVEMFQVVETSETSLMFHWVTGRATIPPATGYKLECAPLYEESTNLTLNDPSATTATVTGLVSGEVYNCCLVVTSHLDNSSAQCVTNSTNPPVPREAPEMFEANAGERQVNFTWSPPPPTQSEIQHRTPITNYIISCSPSPSSLPRSTPDTLSESITLVVEGFSPNTLYHCSVVAANSAGAGPSANTTFTTLQDYSYFQLFLGSVLETCPDFMSANQRGKLEDIAGSILNVLTQECSSCTTDIISEASFTCDPESPIHVTYQARLEGTSETDSSSFISLIEAWVTMGTTVTVGGEILTVSPNCPVSIFSLEEKLCTAAAFNNSDTTSESPSNSTHNNSSIAATNIDNTSESPSNSTHNNSSTASVRNVHSANPGNRWAIIGGTAGAFLIVVLVTAVALIVGLVKYRHERKKKSFKISTEQKDPAVATATNAAYKTFDKRYQIEEWGECRGQDYETVSKPSGLDEQEEQYANVITSKRGGLESDENGQYEQVQKQEERYGNVTASQRKGLESDENGLDEWVQKQEEQYGNVMASQRRGLETDENGQDEKQEEQEERYGNVTASQRKGLETDENGQYEKQEEQYWNVTASQRRGLETNENGLDEWVQKQEEQYVNVTASQRGGQESDEDLYDSVYYS